MVLLLIAFSDFFAKYGPGPKVDPEKVTDALDGFPRSGTPTPVAPDYSNLKKQWATLSPSGVKSSAYTASYKPPACPTATVGGWGCTATQLGTGARTNDLIDNEDRDWKRLGGHGVYVGERGSNGRERDCGYGGWARRSHAWVHGVVVRVLI